jgi:tellurite resistance protein TerC
MQNHALLFWILFNVFVVVLLLLDLGVFHRRARAIGFREAIVSSAVWIGLAFGFALLLYFWLGRTHALEFTTGYLVEESLSVDNLFVFLLIFRYFRVPQNYQYKVLYWGIIGALIMRGVFILAGVALIQRFHWVTYVMGAFLLYVGVRLALQGETEVHPERNPILRTVRRFIPVTHEYVGDKFFVRCGGLYATPLFAVLLVVESTDVAFAVDSIPAVLGITRNPFIVYTSNVFAILGLRSLYFALAGLIDLFHYLPYGLSLVLAFIGAKMLLSGFYSIPTEVALGVVVAVLAVSVVLSLTFPPKKAATEEDS